MAQLSKAGQTYLTKEQQQEILALKTAWEQANAAGDDQAKKAANQKAEAIRATAGYQGGTSGNGYTKVNTSVGGASAGEVKKWVDAEYEAGRVTVITDEELKKVIADACERLQMPPVG